MKPKLISFIILTCFCGIATQSCITLSSYQTGRTAGKGNWELELAGSGFILEDEPVSLALFAPPREEEVHLRPYVEMNNYFGITENLDLGIRLNLNIYGALTIKQQLLGGKNSSGAVAIGGSFGAFYYNYRGWDARLPVFFSFHPNKKLCFYVNPSYIYQFGGELMDNRHLYGGNIGVAVKGRAIESAFEVGLFNFFEGESAVKQMGIIGVSLKFVNLGQ